MRGDTRRRLLERHDQCLAFAFTLPQPPSSNVLLQEASPDHFVPTLSSYRSESRVQQAVLLQLFSASFLCRRTPTLAAGSHGTRFSLSSSSVQKSRPPPPAPVCA